MKKNYIAPEILVVPMNIHQTLLNASINGFGGTDNVVTGVTYQGDDVEEEGLDAD